MQWQQGNAQAAGQIVGRRREGAVATHSTHSGTEGRLIDRRSNRQPTHSINSSLGAHADEEDDQVKAGWAGPGRSTVQK